MVKRITALPNMNIPVVVILLWFILIFPSKQSTEPEVPGLALIHSSLNPYVLGS